MSSPHPRSRILLEICVDTPDGLATAIAAGADRIELCADLGVGGLTPSPGLIDAATASPVPVYAMIRPRPGDFVYGTKDVAVMLADIEAIRTAGLAGVVLGASQRDRTLDSPVLSALIAAAGPLGCTLHRAFDLAPDAHDAMEIAIDLGFERILTSGGLSDAGRGRDRLRALVTRARRRIIVMPGGGITSENVGDIVRDTGAIEVHASAKAIDLQDADLVAWRFAPERLARTDADTIRAIRTSIDKAAAGQPSPVSSPVPLTHPA